MTEHLNTDEVTCCRCRVTMTAPTEAGLDAAWVAHVAAAHNEGEAMTEKIHPTLEAVARAIVATALPDDQHEQSLWRDWLPEARAAINVLADSGMFGGNPYARKRLRDIAADPKPPTVQEVLEEHRLGNALAGKVTCRCGWAFISLNVHAGHQADVLCEAGLLKEEA